MTNAIMLQLGALGIVFIFAIKEFFAYLKNKKNGNGIANQKTLDNILLEMKTQNTNHLHSIENSMNGGFADITRCYNDNCREMIELLGEINGKLSK